MKVRTGLRVGDRISRSYISWLDMTAQADEMRRLEDRRDARMAVALLAVAVAVSAVLWVWLLVTG